ncbi:Holliday junction resolvase RuvX [Candidatus Saccharibacteria bacterium]|nr:Holliday junction resolvase RuvX [Candidatus Saccharibacteria bacterium]
MQAEPKQLIGLDVGQKRTGIARASSIARLAEPLATVETTELQTKLKELFEQYDPEIVVIGLPRNLNSEDTEQTRWVRDYMKELMSRFPERKFHWQDEALTTVAAGQESNAKKPTEIDARAAAIILQDFLNEPAGQNV